MRNTLGLILSGFLLAPLSLQAAEWPTKPVTLIVPFAPGGSTDATARIVGQKLAELTGQPFLVENRPGGGGAVGATAVMSSEPDGHTLLVGSGGTFTVSEFLYKEPAYRTEEDFAPIGILAENVYLVTVGKASPYTTIQELFAAIKEQPDTITYGSSGVGGGMHIATAHLANEGELDVVHIPYKGAGPAKLALASGEIDFSFLAIGDSLPLIESGDIRALAVSTLERDPVLPDVPTLNETVLPGFWKTGWLAMAAPKATPKEIVDEISRRLLEAVAMPETQEILSSQGFKPSSMTPDELSELIKAEAVAHQKVIAEAEIPLQ